MGSFTDILDVAVKFGLAVVLSGAIGLERERKGRSAGLRTHVLVCLSSTLAMILADRLAHAWAESGRTVWLDQGRIAAGILTGIGFIGAGTIINVGNVHRGLTTAATVWYVAVLGLVVGTGYWELAVFSTILALIIVVGLEQLASRLPGESEYALTIRQLSGLDGVREVERLVLAEGLRAAPSRIHLGGKGRKIDLTVDVVAHRSSDVQRLVYQLQKRLGEDVEITIER